MHYQLICFFQSEKSSPKVVISCCLIKKHNTQKKTTAKPGVDSGIHHPPSRPVSSGKNSSSGGASFGHGNCGPWPEGQRVGFTVTWLSSRIRPYGEGHAMVYRGFPKGHGGDGYMLNIYIYISSHIYRLAPKMWWRWDIFFWVNIFVIVFSGWSLLKSGGEISTIHSVWNVCHGP